MGHEVTIITSNYLYPSGAYSVLRRRFPSRQVASGDEMDDGVRVLRLHSFEFAGRLWIRGLAQSLREFDPHVIHCHNLLQFHPPRVAWLRARGQSGAAIVVDDHMHSGFVRRSALGQLFYGTYRLVGQPILARYVDRFSAIAEDTREYMRTECGVKATIDLVPLGVEVDRLVPDPIRRQQIRDQLGLTALDLVFLYTGKVIPDKGVHLLVEAAGALQSEGRRVAVIVVGDADEAYERHLRSMSRRGSSQVALHLIPSVENDRLPEWYGAADVGVWPRQESMSVFEAMAAGLPVVVSAASGLAHIVEQGRGLTYRPETATALANSLRGLTDPAVRDRFGREGRALAETELSWERSAERYLRIYRQAIAAHAAS